MNLSKHSVVVHRKWIWWPYTLVMFCFTVHKPIHQTLTLRCTCNLLVWAHSRVIVSSNQSIRSDPINRKTRPRWVRWPILHTWPVSSLDAASVMMWWSFKSYHGNRPICDTYVTPVTPQLGHGDTFCKSVLCFPKMQLGWKFDDPCCTQSRVIMVTSQLVTYLWPQLPHN